MAVVQAEKAMLILMILNAFAMVFGFLASIPMVMHVYPQSECLLFSHPFGGGRLSYGTHATCNLVAYVFLFVIIGALYLFVRCFYERRRRHGHAKAGKFEDQHVPKTILGIHAAVTCLALLLTLITTAGYIAACENLHDIVSQNVQNKLNTNPYETRGEEILTRYEDDYKFHRYTNRYGNAFGSEFYTIRVTCRSILTDPEIHQKLHDTHYERQSRYYGYWYGQDLYAYDSQYEATKTNALIEASLGGSWICFAVLLAGLILMIIQRCVLKKEAEEAERMSVHSTMMGSLHRDNGSMAGYPRNGSVLSGSMRAGSNFQRGGSLRGSNHSIKSNRRDIDDIALANHHSLHLGGSQHLLGGGGAGGYGRKDIDDMVLNQHIAMNSHHQLGGDGLQQYPPSHYSSRETGYNSGTETQSSRLNPRGFLNPESTFLQREEVETEIF